MKDRYFEHIVRCLKASIKDAKDGVDCHIPVVIVLNAVDLMKEHEEQIKNRDESQEAVKPIRDANCVRMFRCGACGEYVGFIDSDQGDPNEQDNYCRNCGKAVKWNE